jgi:SPP1 family phage portal protein
MDEIIQLLQTNPNAAIDKLKAFALDKAEIDLLMKEFNEVERVGRTTQVGNIQKDKIIGEDASKQKVVKKVRISIPFQNKIVRTATAFEVGEAPSIIPEERNALSDEILRLWKVNRIDHVLQQAKTLQKSELQCAISFYIKTIDSDNTFSKVLGLNKTRELKVRLLKNENGLMYPYFDAYGDMKAFVWEFTIKNGDNDEKHIWVYDDQYIYFIGPTSAGSFGFVKKEKHGFKNIPVVYLSQKKPEWFEVQEMIDRLEVSISKAGDANDYTGHPILKLIGDVQGAPEKDDEGKAFVLPLKYNEETEKMEHGDVDFLTYDQAPEAVKLEQDRLEKYIYSMTSTPDISFDNIKGLGNVSGVALKIMFLDAMLKAKMNEGENKTIIERINNVLISGTITTIATGLAKLADKTFFNVQFNSIIPDDLKDSVETLSKAVEGKFMSRKKAVEVWNKADDYEDEIEQIELESKASGPVAPGNDPSDPPVNVPPTPPATE